MRELRTQRLKLSTRAFNARGGRIKRCDSCLLPLDNCLCCVRPEPIAQCAFLLLMYESEYYKPSNTGRLVADIARENYAFLWHRTQPDSSLLNVLSDSRYYPVVVFPHSYAAPERCINELPSQPIALMGKTPLFILLDGTWREAKKMFTKSPYLNALPVLGIEPTARSSYVLREAAQSHHLCTAEVAIALLHLINDVQAAHSLQDYFEQFRARYLCGKRHLAYDKRLSGTNSSSSTKE